ncbi:sensor histidine kinase [Vibrio sonorensis]|uniref:sensor histidine kinase n=1 Tax=Vibrio sonorensis TaxID=1004316 RepID=UPI0008DA697D|nr:cache domain-containing protein [Vibrio sonorensis]
MHNNRSFLGLWHHRFKTMVRYRLLFLTSAPILLTLLALIAITIYWSIHYTWQSALIDVSERLEVANNSIDLIQEKQVSSIRSLSESYQFQMQRQEAHKIQTWVKNQKERYELDFLTYRPINAINDPERLEKLAKQPSFFDVLSPQELRQLDKDLTVRAQIPILNSQSIEDRGLVSRTVLPVIDEYNNTIGYLDGGLILNNSTVLVDRLRDLIYPSSQDSLRPVGTVTVFLDDLRVSTNVPLDSNERVGRAIGTRVSSEVNRTVLGQGKSWINRAFVYDAWYITAYQPLVDHEKNVIGMLYTGYLVWPFISAYLTNIVEISVFTIALLILSGIAVYRGSRDLFRPIERIHRVVKMVQLGKDQRIGQLGLDEQHELAQLAKQFDNMLDLLNQQKTELEKSAIELEGKVEKRTASLKDKTQQLEHHIELLNDTRDKLIVNEKLAALGELTAGIAHEINNPTAVILGNVELIQFELGSECERVDEEIKAILAQIDRIRNITRSLLQYSRQGGIQDEITWQHINPIIEESVTLVKTGAKKRKIEFEVHLNAQTSVEINRHQLLQILVNLQMNGIHAMKEQGTLTISSEDWIENGESIGALIHIEDQGCGIKEEQLKRIFSPFFTTKRNGTGLGLSVSQSILSQTGGELKVASQWGVGSKFSIYLPKKAQIKLLATT